MVVCRRLRLVLEIAWPKTVEMSVERRNSGEEVKRSRVPEL